MSRIFRTVLRTSLPCLLAAVAVWAQAGPASAPLNAAAEPAFNRAALAPFGKQPPADAPDLTRQPTLYVVGYAHLDTEWRWDYPQVIRDYLSKTLSVNFDFIQKYPHYIFNFTGANRYMMFQEYYPADFAKLKQYVAEGRWYPAGASMEENDVNAPNAESILRQVLYGNEYFRREFGKASLEYMLPDCFGFPASLPSILSHAGLLGFSTQKLSAGWQPAAHVGGPDSPEKTPEGIPFNVGLWTGPDGRSIIAATNPGDYGSSVTDDLSRHPLENLLDANYRRAHPDADPVTLDGQLTGIYTDYHYVGTGDTGGGPSESSVAAMEAIMTQGMYAFPAGRGRGGFGRGAAANTPPPPPPAPQRLGDGPVHVLWSNGDAMFVNMAARDDLSKLPRYTGDLELINHSAGSLTSEAEHKQWNRENEVLAGAAEAAAVGAMWLGGEAYPQSRLNDGWRLLLGGQFHDIMAGTADPGAYTFSWNDDVLAANQFSIALSGATQAIAAGLDTAGAGTALVVYNPLNIARQDIVEANVNFPQGTPKAVRVVGPEGAPVAAQLEAGDGGQPRVVFAASVPPLGFAVYHVEPASAPPASSLKAGPSSLENARYRIAIDADGDIASIFDKKLNKELLSAPMRLAFQAEAPRQWPAWNMDWTDQSKPPRGYVSGPADVRVVEDGPARVAVQVTRESEGSRFAQTVRLAAGDAGNRVEFFDAIDWKSAGAALKAVFPLTASNPEATYNQDIGTINRLNDDERKFEVMSHQWVDLTDRGAGFGTTLLTGTRNGSDKPDDHTLRLTLLYTPGISPSAGTAYADQSSQDWGHHEFLYGLAGHVDGWREGETDWQAQRLNDPLLAFVTASHAGPLGTTWSLLHVDNDRIRVLALKKAEDGDEVVVRMVELAGEAQPDVHVRFAAPVTAAREVNGQEQTVGAATVRAGELVTSFTAYQPRTFAVKLAAGAKVAAPASQPVTLNYDRAVATRDGQPAQGGGFDDEGDSLPAEMLPAQLNYRGVAFRLASGGAGQNDAVTARGQAIALPAGDYNRVYVLAAATDGDQHATFQIGGKAQAATVQDWTGFIGEWDTRLWQQRQVEAPARGGRGRGATPLPGRQAAPPSPPRMITVTTYAGLTPGFVKPAPVAWYASHHHTAAGENVPYSYSYLFAYGFDLPAGATTVTLPDNPNVRVLAISVARERPEATPAQPLHDMEPHHTDTAIYTSMTPVDTVQWPQPKN